MTQEDPKTTIRRLLAERDVIRTAEIAAATGLTRQAVQRHLRAMVASGELRPEGRGRAIRYRSGRPAAARLRLPLAGQDEDAVYRRLCAEAPAVAELTGAARDVVQYALTELVNNAIDHSGGSTLEVVVEAGDGRLAFEIIDDGVGVFEHVQRGLGLSSALEAVQEVSKGKVTTAPDRHSGEGLFFVSKAVDFFEAESGRLRWIVDNLRGETALGEGPPRAGTRVRIELRPGVPRDLGALFAEYTHDLRFTKTRAFVKLFDYGVRFISRSEAKRLVRGLEAFEEVTFDFKGVESVGQGFADEVFRVWARQHPEVRLEPVNMLETVAFMVGRAQRAAEAGGL